MPGFGQFILRDFKKGSVIFVSNIVLTYLFSNVDFLNFIPFWIPHIILMIWAIFDVYDKIEERDGRKSATRYVAFSFLIVVILFPLTITLFATGLFKGAEFFTNEYLNEDRTRTEMSEISNQLEIHKNHYGVYPKNYNSFIGQKPIWNGWKTDSWKNPYKYELLDSLGYKLILAGKDGVYFSEDDIISGN